VTDRKRAEAERAALLADAEAANRAKDEFLAMFGHELRNPLAAIASAAVVLAAARTVQDIARPRAVIDRQVHHLRRLVDDLLDVARIRSGSVALDRRPLNLAEAVDHAVGVVRSGTVGSRHTIEVHADDVGVNADATRLEQIILNLISNAVKFTPAGRMIRVVVRDEGSQAVLRVEDDGVGIPADVLPRIFGLFVHGGTIEAASEGADRGSVFTVRLPRIALTESASTAGGDPGRIGRTRRQVLIVEDNDDVREMLKAWLEHEGHEVLEAADGAAAIRIVADFQPALALIDIGLPLVDGFEVARYIRRQPRQPQRLIALTGYGQDEDRQRCLAAGFDEHLVKPIDPHRLTTLLDDVA
jgi:CheY-like chemotaxis protein/two-component sensor histidine kinase